MILLELVDNNQGRTVMESTTRRKLYRELRTKYGVEPKLALATGDWQIRSQEYGFQPQCYVDIFGNGVYSPTTFDEDYRSQYPEFETPEEAIEYLESHHIFGAVQRMAIFTQQDGKKVRWTAGVIYTSEDAPSSPITVLTATPRHSKKGGTRWNTTHAAARFDLLCRATETCLDA